MKASHLTTPRTLADCDFQAWADPIEAPAPSRGGWDLVMAAVAIVGTALAFALGG